MGHNCGNDNPEDAIEQRWANDSMGHTIQQHCANANPEDTAEQQ